MATKKATATKELINAATINRVVSKETGKCLGYLIKSNSNSSYYQITWNRERKAYQCNCAATVKCCHIKALEQVLAAKKEIARANNLCNFFAALATYAQQQVAEQAVQEVEKQVTSKPATNHRYCDACSCALPLQLIDGLQLCATCAANTQPTKKTPTVATKRQTSPLGSNKVFSLMR